MMRCFINAPYVYISAFLCLENYTNYEYYKYCLHYSTKRISEKKRIAANIQVN